MTDLRKAAQDVVDVWRMYGTAKSLRGWMEILEAALKEQQTQQEPVAWRHKGAGHFTVTPLVSKFSEWEPLYAAPPQRKPMTDEEIDRITDAQWAANNHKPMYAAHRAYARAIERAHNII